MNIRLGFYNTHRDNLAKHVTRTKMNEKKLISLHMELNKVMTEEEVQAICHLAAFGLKTLLKSFKGNKK